jgi:hypothetical protein
MIVNYINFRTIFMVPEGGQLRTKNDGVHNYFDTEKLINMMAMLLQFQRCFIRICPSKKYLNSISCRTKLLPQFLPVATRIHK